jgi:trans-aconitate methyltransferase
MNRPTPEPAKGLAPSQRPDRPEYFDAMFEASDDPWEFATRWYEKRKRAMTLACLPQDRYAHGFEPGCANGELSAKLATRCERLLVSDGIDRAVELSRQRLRHHDNVQVRKAWVPDDWPNDTFDLIVLSEFLFYLQPETLERIAAKVQDTLAPGGTLLACHWRKPIADCVLTGDTAHHQLHKLLQLPKLCKVMDADFRIDVWSAAPGVAAREGLS